MLGWSQRLTNTETSHQANTLALGKNSRSDTPPATHAFINSTVYAPHSRIFKSQDARLFGLMAVLSAINQTPTITMLAGVVMALTRITSTRHCLISNTQDLCRGHISLAPHSTIKIRWQHLPEAANFYHNRNPPSTTNLPQTWQTKPRIHRLIHQSFNSKTYR